ncbi:hypothetical protein ARMGADRAFT_1005117 [Armillaria gallica]|uniref:F-box domain-containing protein n=1 Tax=Armillaria gallica TaxID=47427 RepID=A0A2H3EP28_ARMGA|nr:hypothetical protein ARMGADRAFT_1005117 [Armillaria gallica]
MSKRRLTVRSLRSGPVVVPRHRIRKDLIASLPQELVNLIIDNLKHNYRSLLSCSLVCRAFVSRTREIPFRRIFLSSGAICNKLLLLPTSTLVCIKSLQMIYSILGGTQSVLNHPAFPQLMTQFGPLRLTLGHLPWSQLNGGARWALSTHSFRNIKLEQSTFPSVADLCDFLRGSHELDTLILEDLEIEDTFVPSSYSHDQKGASVSRLRLRAHNKESSIFKTIIDARVCPVSFDKLCDLDVTISSAEELVTLQNALEKLDTLKTLKISHILYDSHDGPLPRPRLNLKTVHHLKLQLHDFHNTTSPTVHADLFEWWYEVWATTKVTSMEELSIKTYFESRWDDGYDVAVWSKIVTALSRPAWARLSELLIIIDADEYDLGQDLYPYRDAILCAIKNSSMDVWVEVEYPAVHYEPDEAMYSGSEDEREDEDVGYSDLDDW